MKNSIDILTTLKEVENHLILCGYAVSTATLNRHKKDGKFSPGKNGFYRVTQIDEYAEKYLDRSNADDDGTNEQKLRAQIRSLTADAETKEHRLEVLKGKYVLESQVEIMLAQRAQGLKGYFESFSRGMAGAVIKSVDATAGQSASDRESQLRDYLLAIYRKAFDIYARGVIIDDDD